MKQTKKEPEVVRGPGKTFKLPKQFKRIMATIVDKDMRDDYRNISIRAQLQSLEKPKSKKSDNIVESDE